MTSAKGIAHLNSVRPARVGRRLAAAALVAAGGWSLWAGGPARAATPLSPTDVYDRDAGVEGLNQVDLNATGDGKFSNASPNDYLTFKTDVNNAFLSATGGVFDFENFSGTSEFVNTNGDTSFALALPGGKTLTLNAPMRITTFGSDTAISGNYSAIARDAGLSTDVSNITFAFGALAGGRANEGVVRFGITYLGRNTLDTGVVTGRATFSDGTLSAPLTATIGNGPTQDTFFGFTAPANRTITSVSFTSNANKTFDDLGIITGIGAVPEPSSLALLGLGAAALVTRRRRRA